MQPSSPCESRDSVPHAFDIISSMARHVLASLLILSLQTAACWTALQSLPSMRPAKARSAHISTSCITTRSPHATDRVCVRNNIIMVATDLKRVARKPIKRHLTPGPVMLSWTFGLMTLFMQALLTDSAQLALDASLFWASVNEHVHLAGDFLLASDAKVAALYVFLWLNVVGSSFVVFPRAPTRQHDRDSDGYRKPVQVPYRSQDMPQHQLTAIDWSYVVLNSLCMPGFFYHFACLIKSWGYDWTAPPLDHGSVFETCRRLFEKAPEAVFSAAIYMLIYEFVYYRWHRAMHEIPWLYMWVHQHHHQQSYPDRPALDTFNTGCVESQVGLYAQLAVLWGCRQFLGLGCIPGAVLFFTTAGWLSVLEHDKYDRALPFDIWRADDHHMHHACVYNQQ